MMKKIIVMFVVLGLIRVEIQPVPEYHIINFGPRNHFYQKYDAVRDVFLDTSLRSELWCLNGRDQVSPATGKTCWEPIEVPARKKFTFSLRTDIFREEWWHYSAAAPVFVGHTRRIRPIYIHCKPDHGYDERFDTVMMVNGTVAVLNQVTNSLLGYPGLAIDESYPGPNLEGKERSVVLNLVRNEVEQALRVGEEPVIYCTLLYYNARGALELLQSLKQEFGNRVRTGVGGQLVTMCSNAYRSGRSAQFIDQVAVGDAEVCLGAMLLGRQPFVRGEKEVTAQDHYALPLYSNESYLGLAERLDEMARYQFGEITGIRQLITESVRGCSWAYAIRRACKFCALTGVLNKPVFRGLEEHFALERDLAERFGANWIFDVSNQWLPEAKPDQQVEWLEGYVAARRQLGASDISRYVYLTTNSITAHTAPLLREAGVRCAYIGIDGWDTATKRASYKTLASHERALEACKANGIYVRTSLVIGSGLNRSNIDALPGFVKGTMERFGGNPILSFGNFLEIVIPGSEDWSSLRKEAQGPTTPYLREIGEIFRRFDTDGYLTLDDQERLNELRIRHTQPLEYEAVVEARDRAVLAVKKSNAVSVTLRECEHLQKT